MIDPGPSEPVESQPDPSESTSSEPRQDRAASGPTATAAPTTTEPDPLRGSRTSGFWIAVIALLVVIVLLAVFVLQNTRSVEITFLAWTGTAPLAAALLIAAAAGLAVAAIAGSLRILQLRRRVKRTRRH